MSYITYEVLLHNTLALDVDTVQERCILWAQYVDRPDSWIALRNLWILTSRRNPWINYLARSVDFAKFCVYYK